MPRFLNPQNTIFVLLSFEGPDEYSQAGGLGVRMTELSRVLAEHEYLNHFFFVGDPYKGGEEHLINGKLVLHRWCQWLSHYHQGGVYDGLTGKINDWDESLPGFIIDNIIRPSASEGKLIVLLSEDWHTARTTYILDYHLRRSGLRDHCVMFWNVNNEFGLHRIDLETLDSICTITTVSHFMNSRLQSYGLNPLVIPNGIPRRILGEVDPYCKYLLSESFEGLLLQKVGRFDPNKRWLEAVTAINILRTAGAQPHLIMRGGLGGHRLDVMELIHRYGLTYASINVNVPTFENILEALRYHRHCDILELEFFVPEEFLMLLYGSADAVLANSGYEPFGIVGLEVMAKGGIAILGNTGEDYATSFHNSFRLQTDNPGEIASYILRVRDDGALREHIRGNARITSHNFTWDNVVDNLIEEVEDIAMLLNLAHR